MSKLRVDMLETLDGSLAFSLTEVLQKETITVGIPSDYPTLQEAIDGLSTTSTKQGVIIDLVIESGHQPSSGILVENGDYSHFRVSSQDPEVTVAVGFGNSVSFIEGKYSRLPILNCLVNGNSGEMGRGYQVRDGSVGYVSPGCGAKNCWQDGLSVKFAATCYAKGSVFTGNAVNGTTSSNIHVLGGTCFAEDAVATASNYYGVQASSGGILVFRNGDASNAVRYGMRARDQGNIDAESALANDCGLEGIRAFIGGHVNFRNGQAERAGQAGISASRGSTVSANGASLIDSLGYGVNATSASTVDVDGATITGCTDSGIRCDAAIVSAFTATISSNARGIESSSGGIVKADSTVIQNNSAYGISSNGGSTVSAVSAQINGNTPGVTCRGIVDVSDANCESNINRGIYALDGGRIVAVNALCQMVPGTDEGGLTADITCLTGGMIHAEGAAGGLNKVANSLNSDGVIFRT